MRALVVVLGCCLLAGCGAGDAAERGAEALAETPTTMTPTMPTPTVNLGGEDGSGDLSEFRCGEGDDGVWSASGLITNPMDNELDYQVTVLVSGPADARPQARQRLLSGVRSDDPVSFEIPEVPVSGSGDLACQVRVVRLP